MIGKMKSKKASFFENHLNQKLVKKSPNHFDPGFWWTLGWIEGYLFRPFCQKGDIVL